MTLHKTVHKSARVFVVLFCISLINVVSGASYYLDLARTTIGSTVTDEGYALSFDNTDDYVTITDSVSLDLNESWTFECWIRNTTSVSNADTFIAHHAIGYGTTIRANNAGGVSIRHANFAGSESTLNYESLVFNGNWIHIVCTYNDPTRTIYVNGSNVASDSKAGGTYQSAQATYFGASPLDGQYVGCDIDEFRIYNRELNTTEITDSYNSGAGNYTPFNQTGLVVWMHLDEGSGTTLDDETANNNDGSLTGDTDEWITGFILTSTPLYPAEILLEDLESGYLVKVFNASQEVDSTSVNASGYATLTLNESYRQSSFDGDFRIYYGNDTFIFSKWFPDVHGGDQYRAIGEDWSFAIIAFIIACCAVAMIVIWK